jgi:tRNA pseudouridine38-40 synthase
MKRAKIALERLFSTKNMTYSFMHSSNVTSARSADYYATNKSFVNRSLKRPGAKTSTTNLLRRLKISTFASSSSSSLNDYDHENQENEQTGTVKVNPREKKQSYDDFGDRGNDQSLIARGVFGENVHPSHLLTEEMIRGFAVKSAESENDEREKKKKKKMNVALVVAYVGNDFKGNTQNLVLPRGSTVDDVIEDAVYDAGGILLSNYRSKGLKRLKWTRSSRTDKGVSSLMTVVGMKMEVPVDAYDSNTNSSDDCDDRDDDDLVVVEEAKESIVKKINEHLPTNVVKAFACFKATKSFDARRAAISRTYEYLLPLKCLRYNENGDELEKFREALKMFEGSHPFHNYTKRGRYGAGKSTRGNSNRRSSFSRNRNDRNNSDKNNNDEEVDDEIGETIVVDDTVEEEEEEIELPNRIETSGKQTYWLLEKDMNDLVHIMHYRRIHEFTCSETAETIPGFESYPFVRVKVYGESFMLHQIRKMIATAVLVALDCEKTPTMPLSFIKASLSRPCRVVTPMAPPLTLFLTGAEFMNFRKTNDNENGVDSIENPSSPALNRRRRSLKISQNTQSEIDEFRHTCLYPKLAESFSSEEWDSFIEQVQDVEPTREEYLRIVAQYEIYETLRKQRELEKRQEEEEEQEEEENNLPVTSSIACVDI